MKTYTKSELASEFDETDCAELACSIEHVFNNSHSNMKSSKERMG